MFYLKNNQLAVAITASGAELKSVKGQQNGIEYMWQAHPGYWAKSSPVLFPIVGALKNNSYRYKGNTYSLPRHGFARDQAFSLAQQTEDSLSFLLRSQTATLALYPFPFSFWITYTLQANALTVQYRVQNEGSGEMYFSVGGHPAFNVPLVPGTAYADYRLLFNQNETAGRWPIAAGGLLQTEPEPLLLHSPVLPLHKDLFARDAIVLKHLQSNTVRLESDKTPHGLQFSFDGFPYLGLWAAPAADFLCIEPWCGIADSVQAHGELTGKEGINRLAAGAEFSVAWRVQFF